MKKLHELIKPFLAVIFGALLILCYLNMLAGEGGALALGIVAIVMASYYIAYGIMRVVLGDKLAPLANKILEVIAVLLFVAFFFTQEMILVINMAKAETLTPTGWFVSIYSLAAAFLFIIFFILGSCLKSRTIRRVAQLLGMLFVLVLVLDLIIANDGRLQTLGGLVILEVVLYAVYSSLLISSVSSLGEEKAPIEENSEAPQE